MKQASLIKARDKAFDHIADIFHDVTEGRWDNTHTAGKLRAAVAMHEAACRELYRSRVGRALSDQEAICIRNAVSILRETIDNNYADFDRLRLAITNLEAALDEGGGM